MLGLLLRERFGGEEGGWLGRGRFSNTRICPNASAVTMYTGCSSTNSSMPLLNKLPVMLLLARFWMMGGLEAEGGVSASGGWNLFVCGCKSEVVGLLPKEDESLGDSCEEDRDKEDGLGFEVVGLIMFIMEEMLLPRV